MKLVHNSDEEKNLCNSLSHIVVILCCFPWMKISVLSSQHNIQVLSIQVLICSCRVFIHMCILQTVASFKGS